MIHLVLVMWFDANPANLDKNMKGNHRSAERGIVIIENPVQDFE